MMYQLAWVSTLLEYSFSQQLELLLMFTNFYLVLYCPALGTSTAHQSDPVARKFGDP